MTIAPERGRWLREPLLHFLIIGTGLFLLVYAGRWILNRRRTRPVRWQR